MLKFVALLFTLFVSLVNVSKATDMHVVQNIEGWQVHVDQQLLEGEGKSTGDVGLRLLANKLFDIKLRLPEARIKQLQTVHIWIDYKHELTNMQYHPNVNWLTDHNYDPAMERCVHIARAQGLIDHVQTHTQPWSVLHELAHAYHDQFLGWEHPGIKAAWEEFCKDEKYQSTLLINGNRNKHYALTNQKEFFAEMSESFIGTNDFYPFVRGELKEDFPEVHALLKSIWLE